MADTTIGERKWNYSHKASSEVTNSKPEKKWINTQGNQKRKRVEQSGERDRRTKVAVDTYKAAEKEDLEEIVDCTELPRTSAVPEVDVATKLYLEVNTLVLQCFLILLFSPKNSVFRLQIFKKWLLAISSTSEEARDEDLKRLLLKIGSCKGCLEIGDKYIQIFDEGDRDQPEERELHLPATLSEFKVFERPLSMLKRFCSVQNTEFVMNYKTYTKYKHNDLLTNFLDASRVSILYGFIQHFVLCHDATRFYGKDMDNCVRRQKICVLKVLDFMIRDSTIDLPVSLYRVAEESLGKLMEHSPIRDSSLHFNVDPDVEKVIAQARAEAEAERRREDVEGRK